MAKSKFMKEEYDFINMVSSPNKYLKYLCAESPLMKKENALNHDLNERENGGITDDQPDGAVVS